MLLTNIQGGYGVVARINTPNLEKTITWYEEKLGMTNDTRYYLENHWAQLNFPGITNIALGLAVGKPNPSYRDSSVITIVVDDIESAHQMLKDEGVSVGDIKDVGLGVKLAYFMDLAGNALALRQNPPELPQAMYVGEY